MQLTATNLEVKKFVAFQEGFERLFDIMKAEGMLEGGDVIVKDCLDACLNVLTGSSLTKVRLSLIDDPPPDVNRRRSPVRLRAERPAR